VTGITDEKSFEIQEYADYTAAFYPYVSIGHKAFCFDGNTT
jgi:hypothetical protein